MNQNNAKLLLRLALVAVLATASARALDFKSLYAAAKGPKLEAGNDGPFCDICESSVKKFQSMVNDPQFIDQLHQQLDSICDSLKFLDQDKQCKQFINKNIDQAIESVRKVKPLEFCRNMNLCSEQQLADRLLVEDDFQPIEEDSNSVRTPVCDHCLKTVAKLGAFVKAHQGHLSIGRVVKEVCPHFSDQKDKQTCATILLLMGDQAIEELRKMENPMEFCKETVRVC